MLQNNVTLLKIDLSDNGFSDSDTSYLLEALKVGYTNDITLRYSGSSVPLNTERTIRGILAWPSRQSVHVDTEL